jgi:ribosome maturation factor RimP
MPPAHEKLDGLDRDRLLAVVEPVLRAHGVDAVELIWRPDRGGWLLYLTVERPGTREPGAGVTLDLCAEISHDLSAALDVADVIAGRYRLEVGSPGLERALYRLEDYERFAGQIAKVKLREAIDGQGTVRGVLRGVEEGAVLIETDHGMLRVAADGIDSGRLVFDWRKGSANGSSASRSRRGAKARRASQRTR